MRRHPDWLQGYIELCAHSEAPEKFHLWTGISTIAGALRRRVWIDQKYFEWVPNFYIVLVGPPGIVTKSTTISIGHALLGEIEGIKFGPQIITWQALAQSLAGSTELIEVAPGSFQPMSAVTISVSELGTFLDTREMQMIDLLADLWDGKRGVVAKHTKTQGNDEIENPWVNLIACTTPAWLRKNVDENLMTGGLASRIIWLYADEKRHLAAYPAQKIPVTFEQKRLWLLQDLAEIGELCGEMRLTPGAYKWGEDWYAKHYARLAAGNISDSISGMLARAQTHIHKLAMVLSVSESNSLEITEQHLARATDMLKDVEAELPYIYGLIRETASVRLASEVAEHIERCGQCELSDLFQIFWSWGWNDFRYAIEAAQAAGRIHYDGKVVKKGARI